MFLGLILDLKFKGEKLVDFNFELYLKGMKLFELILELNI